MPPARIQRKGPACSVDRRLAYPGSSYPPSATLVFENAVLFCPYRDAHARKKRVEIRLANQGRTGQTEHNVGACSCPAGTGLATFRLAGRAPRARQNTERTWKKR